MSKTFLARFPEFDDPQQEGDRGAISLSLKAAEQELNPTLWGPLLDEGILYLAADKLTRSAVGERFRPEDASAQSVYGMEFERLCRVISMGARVI